MRAWFLFGSAVIMATLAFCSGCASPSADKSAQADSQPAMRAPGEPLPSPASSDTSSSEAPTDESVGTAIRRRLNADPATAVGIVVEVEDGKVTLHGAAPNLAASWRAEGAARGVAGVKSVANQIIVNTPSVTQ
ncbi:MAG: BON domain-containing protein [Verrucomicrobiia bacterium]